MQCGTYFFYDKGLRKTLRPQAVKIESGFGRSTSEVQLRNAFYFNNKCNFAPNCPLALVPMASTLSSGDSHAHSRTRLNATAARPPQQSWSLPLHHSEIVDATLALHISDTLRRVRLRGDNIGRAAEGKQASAPSNRIAQTT